MLSPRPAARPVKPNNTSGAALDELLELETLLLEELELFLLLLLEPQATRPAPIKAATAVCTLPFKNERRCSWRASSTEAKVRFSEKLDSGSSPLLSTTSGLFLSTIESVSMQNGCVV